MRFTRRFLPALSLALFPLLAAAAETMPAFPGAEGAGAYSRGGRGGKVIFVTSLKDYLPGEESVIPGTLRAACTAKGPRTVLFRVSGTIELKETLHITEPYLTIAGQSAPGDGICLKNYRVRVEAHDVVIRYLRCRPGDEVGRRLGKPWETDGVSISGQSRDVILDHCSISWANDEVCSVHGREITNVTVQWCIISESLKESTHEKGRHGYGSLIRANGEVSFHHNLYAFHQSRTPRPGSRGDGCLLFDFRNNLLHKGGHGYTAADPVRMNFVGNHHENTPFHASGSCRYYREGNVGEISGGHRQDEPFEVAEVTTTTAEAAREAILESCGAILPKRDAVDRRIVELVKSGAGKLIDSADEVGGWPELKSTQPPSDRDEDGMPDAWEREFGGATALDANQDPDQDGYTNLEEYLNDTDPQIDTEPRP